jgi:hypothetical protein
MTLAPPAILSFRSTIARNTLANANAVRDWRIYAEFAQHLIAIARRIYADDPMALELDETVYALDSTPFLSSVLGSGIPASRSQTESSTRGRWPIPVGAPSSLGAPLSKRRHKAVGSAVSIARLRTCSGTAVTANKPLARCPEMWHNSHRPAGVVQ